jgi:hypothetical protein
LKAQRGEELTITQIAQLPRLTLHIPKQIIGKNIDQNVGLQKNNKEK